MLVTTDDKKQYEIVLRPFDGKQWLPDCAGDILDTWSAGLYEVLQADIEYLQQEVQAFNNGEDLDWLMHCPVCQECSLEVQEVQEDD